MLTLGVAVKRPYRDDDIRLGEAVEDIPFEQLIISTIQFLGRNLFFDYTKPAAVHLADPGRMEDSGN